MNKGCANILSVISLLIMYACGCSAGMLVSNLFSSGVQEQTCFDYARKKALPEIEYLELTGVVIATNQFRGHVCNFKDKRTGFPITLKFDEADIPYGTDTGQVLLMVIPFLCTMLPVSFVIARIARRYGVQLFWDYQRPQNTENDSEI